MKKIIFAFVFMATTLASTAQTTFWFDNATISGTEITVPVKVSGFDSIQAMYMNIKYAPTQNLQYWGVTNLNWNLMMPVVNIIIGIDTNIIVLTSFSSGCMSVPDSAILFAIRFKIFNGGVTNFIWDSSSISINDCSGNIVIPTLINGSVGAYTSIRETQKLEHVPFPNPSIDFIEFSSRVKYVRVYDVLGNVLISDAGGKKIDMTAIKSGIYVVETEYGKTKIVKQ